MSANARQRLRAANGKSPPLPQTQRQGWGTLVSRRWRKCKNLGGPPRWMTLLVLLLTAPISSAQSSDSSSYQISGGLSSLSNTINGVPGARQPLLGWEASLAAPAWRNLRFKIDYSGYLGNNRGAPQHPYFIVAGGEYEHHLGKEKLDRKSVV